MKTKDEVKKSSSQWPPHPARYSRHPLPTGEGCRRGLFGEPTQSAKYKNRGNEAKKSLKTKEDGCYKVQKRTQNEAKFEHNTHQSNTNSGVVSRDGKKPLSRLATLAAVSPTGEGFSDGRLLRPARANREKRAKIHKIVGTNSRM